MIAVVGCVIGTHTVCVGAVAKKSQARPNILYIFTDDQTYRSVSAYEGAQPWCQTPNIDRLAASGMRFTTCYTGAWCQPSRATALTGLLQHGHQTLKVTDYPMASYDPEKLRFFPSVFRKNGYETACIGKWHLGEDIGHGRDWDYSVIWDRGANNDKAYYEGTLVRTNGGPRKPLGGYSTDRFTELAVDYIQKKAGSDKPWYLWLCYGGVHGPSTPADRHQDAYADAPPVELPVDMFGPRPTKPGFMRDSSRWTKERDGTVKKFDELVKQYHSAVKSVDEGVGALMAALEKSGQLENTVVIFTSDQGFAWGQHGLRDKAYPYDAALCAPLIIRETGRTPAGSVCKEPVNGADIVSTIHALAGVQPEWPLHGRDLSPLLKDPAAKLVEPMLMMNTCQEYGDRIIDDLKSGNFKPLSKDKMPAWIMMREGKYKYVRYFKGDEIEEIYDLDKDPQELNNLAVNPEYKSMLERLRHKTVEEFRKKEGSFVDLLPTPRSR